MISSDKSINANYLAQVTRPSDFRIEVSTGLRAGYSNVTKFGFNPDIDSSATEAVVSSSGTFNPLTDVISTAQTFTVTYDNASDGAGTSGATQLYFFYLDADGLNAVSVHQLGSSGSDVTSFTGIGINRVAVTLTGGAINNVADISITATDDATTQAHIPAGSGVTQQLIYHVPFNGTFMMEHLGISVQRPIGQNPTVEIKLWSFSRVTNVAYNVEDVRLDTSLTNNFVQNYSGASTVFAKRDVVYVTLSTSSDNTFVSGRFHGILYESQD